MPDLPENYDGPKPNPGATTMFPREFMNALWWIFGRRCLACGTKDSALRSNGAGLFCESCWYGGWGSGRFV